MIADTSLKVHPELITAVPPTSPVRTETRATRRFSGERTTGWAEVFAFMVHCVSM